MRRPLIALPCDCRKLAESSYRFQAIKFTYIEALEEVGCCPLLVPLIHDEERLRQLFNLADGILLPGGDDICPSYYGGIRDEHHIPCHQLRDMIEFKFTKWAVEEKKPVLGICRGMQMINVALGGDLCTDVESVSNRKHQYEIKGEDWPWTALVDEIEVKADTVLSNILKTTKIQINSLHHQCIGRLSTKLKASGVSQDGTIEAIESHPDEEHFLLGLQFHPETLWKEDIRWLGVFRWLANAANKDFLKVNNNLAQNIDFKSSQDIKAA
jgi:putative glutamine amidotransferase